MSDRPQRQWTAAQQEAIRSLGHSLLVSAAAGSGKTSVLAERCAHLVCDAPQRCHVNQLLVVTFTEAAALEMRTRIEQALRHRLDARPGDEHLRRQIVLIEHANISTLHGFCARVLRQHFHRAGIDPGFRVLDGDEATLLRLEVARDLFMDRYDTDAAGDFHRFIDAFGDGKDEALIAKLVATYELLRSLVDPNQWLKRSAARIDEAIEKPFEQSELGREYLAIVKARLADLGRDCNAAIEGISRLKGWEPYANYLQALVTLCRSWWKVLEIKGYDALVDAVESAEIARLPAMSNSLPGKEAATGLLKPVQEQFKKGPLRDALRFSSEQWKTGLRSIRPHAGVLLDLIGEFARRYRRAKDELRALDFSDLERHTLDLLRDGKAPDAPPSAVARLFHRQFRHVLVDEYQDINEVQDAILRLASHECVPDTSTANLFCVGDVKQSIYAFRLAEPSLFLAKEKRFRDATGGGRVIDLQSNFRSRAPLLDSLNAIFERLMTEPATGIEYDTSHRLHPSATFPPAPASAPSFTGAPIELHLLPEKLDSAHDAEDEESTEATVEVEELERSGREALLIAQRIEEMMGLHGQPRMQIAAKEGGYHPIRYRDMVILLRATRFHSDEYADVLRSRGIPVYNAGGGGYFDAMEVRDVLSLLRLLDNPCQDIPMAAVLRSPLSGLPRPEDSLARIRLAYPGDEIPFHQAVTRYAREQDDELSAKLRDFLAELSEWRDIARQRPVADLLWEIFQRTGYLAFCEGLENGPRRRANLLYLHERARQFGTFSRQGLYRFIRFLETLGAETDPAQATDIGEGEDVVRIMSVHKSKGLEFPVVFIPELGKKINFQSATGHIVADRHACLGLMAVDEAKQIRYPSLAHELVTERLRRETIAEEMRVLYVALTRAKEHLILVGTTKRTAEDAAEKWERQWATHQGPMPPSTILAARTSLDWLGPASAMTFDPDKPAIQIFPHPAEEVMEWMRVRAGAHPARDTLGPLARLEPLTPPPAEHPQARQIIDRLQWRYPYMEFCSRPAVQKATEAQVKLEAPQFLRESQSPSPADRGTPTHIFLRHLDFAQPCDDANLTEQLASLVRRKFILAAEAAAIDLTTVRWFLETDLGRLVKSSAASLLRELPLTCTKPTDDTDPLDQQMIRGRLDLLVPDAGGFVLVDYKTDQIPPDAAAFRASHYQDQLAAYREAVERITTKKVTRTCLVFLSARTVVEL